MHAPIFTIYSMKLQKRTQFYHEAFFNYSLLKTYKILDNLLLYSCTQSLKNMLRKLLLECSYNFIALKK